MMTWRCSLILTCLIGIIRGQASPPPTYTYEVASIHLSKPGQTRSTIGAGTGGGLRALNMTAMQLLTFAYRVPEDQIAGAPGWVTSDRFDVTFTPDRTEATPHPGVAMSEADGWMARSQDRMQAVLRDRFGLVFRVETRELSTYTLVVAKGGHKLSPPSDLPGPKFGVSRAQLNALNSPIKMLTDFLSRQLGRPVTDATGLSGQYDFKLEWTPDSSLQGPPDDRAIAGPSIFTALSEQLGLRLESRKGPVAVYVIEKIEKPGDN